MDLILLRFLFVALLAGVCYFLHPFGLDGWVSAGAGAAAAGAVIVFELRVRALTLRRLIGAVAGSVLGIFGALDVPIVYMSNRWWRTQHPAPVFGGAEGSGMDKSMIGPFLWNMLAWMMWGIFVLILRYNVERKHQQYATEEAEEALAANI